MRKFTRLPAILILAATTVAGVAMARSRPAAAPPTDGRIEEIRKLVADKKADGKTLFELAEGLRLKGDHKSAADAYKNALAAPDLDADRMHKAQRGQAMALASAGDDKAFFDYLDELLLADAKTVQEILETREGLAKKSHPRYDITKQSADSQAVD